MNTSFRATALVAALFCVAAWLPAQNQTNVQDDLLRADKQFDLYAYNIARSSYEKVLQSDPNNAHALARIADCYVQTNRPDEALPWYERATNAPGMEPDVMLRYGKALMSTGDYVKAKTWFQFYGEGNPDVGTHFSKMCDYAMAALNKDALYIAKLEPLNTESADYSPAFYAGKVVYNSARSDIKRKTTPKTSSDWSGGSASNQLFITQASPSDGFLQKPDFLRSDLQNTWNEGPLTFSADGRKVVFCRNNFIDGARQIAERGVNLSMYTADVENGEWKNIRAFPYNGSDYATGFPSLSADGKTLWFASNRPDGFGGWDIYVCEWSGSAWLTPRNLGAPLNTAGNEVTPYFDGNNLYFSSDYHRGFGGLDIFRAELSGDNVANIFHLGPGINSPRDDYGFIYDPNANNGYFTSNRAEGRGNEDVWQVRKKLDEFVITVTDEYRNPLADADIDFSSCGAGVMRTDASGQYSFAVSSGKADCNAVVSKAGFQPANVSVRSSGNKRIAISLTRLPDGSFQSRAEPVTSTPPAAASRSMAAPTAPATYSTDAATSASTGTGTMVDHSLSLYDNYGRPLTNAQVDLNTCGLGTLLTDQTGSVAFSLPAGTTCCIVISKDGFDEAVIPITASSAGEKSVSLGELNGPVTPLTAGTVGTYAGSIRDAESLDEIAGATVKAQKLPNGPLMQTTSNNAGRYIFNLEAGGYYQFTFLKKGYQQEVVNFVVTVNNVKRTITPLFLQPSLSATGDAKPAEYSTTTTAPTSVSPASSAPTTSAPLTSAPSSARMMAPQTVQAKTATVDGYAVQVAAQPQQFTDADMKKYDALTPLGNLYAVQDAKMSRLRLGIFATKAEADAANKEVQKTVKGSFVVPEKNAEEQMLVSRPANSAPTEYNTKTAKGAPSGAPVAGVQSLSASTPATVAPIRYAVQVASISSNRSANLNDFVSLTSVGNVYMKPENEFNKVRVGIWESHADAEEAQQEIVQRGFKDAIIVTEKASDESLKNFFISSVQLSEQPATYSTPTTTQTTQSAKTNTPKQTPKSVPTTAPSTYAALSTTPAAPASAAKTAKVAPASATTKSAVPATGTQYLIRVCLMTDVDNFDAKTISGVGGNHELWPVGDTGATAVMLTGYPDPESALTALYRLRERNFPDAYMLKMDNGNLSKLKY